MDGSLETEREGGKVPVSPGLLLGLNPLAAPSDQVTSTLAEHLTDHHLPWLGSMLSNW
jgi:hypothetical protein